MHRCDNWWQWGAALTVLLMVLVGCGQEPSLDGCTVGRYHADCGGNGAPVAACDRNSGECRWFLGGVVPTGFVASACGAHELCCVSLGHAIWPFPDWTPSGATLDQARRDLGLLARGVITEEDPVGVPVRFDLVAPFLERPEASCSSGLEWLDDACNAAQRLVVRRSGDSVVFEVWPGNVGVRTMLDIEVWPTAGSHSARVFYHVLPPGDVPSVVSCGPGGAALAAVGELRLTADAMDSPETAHGVLDIEVPTGGMPAHYHLEF